MREIDIHLKDNAIKKEFSAQSLYQPMQVVYTSKLGEIRKKLGYTAQQVADNTGLYRSHVSAIEAGTKMPTVATLAKLAYVLEVDLMELFTVEICYTAPIDLDQLTLSDDGEIVIPEQ